MSEGNQKNRKDANASTVNAIVMFLIEHKNALIVLGVLLFITLFGYLIGSAADNSKVEEFFSTSLIEMNIGHLLIVIIFWHFLRD